MDVEQLELLNFASGNAQWCGQLGKQLGISLES